MISTIKRTHRLAVMPVLILAIIIPLLLIAPHAYARHLSDSQRYNDGLNDGSQAAISDSQNGNPFNPACDPTGAHTSDGQHTTTYCSGWSNGYTSAWNGDSGSPSSSNNSGQGTQNGNDGQDSSGSGNLIDKAKNFCINNPGLCATIGHGLLSALGL